jgi:hypothetical protein
VLLQCGACTTWRAVVTTIWATDAQERGLEHDRNRIAAALHRLEREHLLRAARSLSAALRHDLVSADDFAIPAARYGEEKR